MKFTKLIAFIIFCLTAVRGKTDLNDAESRLCLRMSATEQCQIIKRDPYYPDDDHDNTHIVEKRCMKFANECMRIRNCMKDCRLDVVIEPYEQTLAKERVYFASPCHIMSIACSRIFSGTEPTNRDPFIFL